MNKKISYGGIGCALTVLFLVLTVYLPSGKASCLFLASLTVYTVCKKANAKTGFICYIASTLLAFFLIPAFLSVSIIFFVVCFGNYPIILNYSIRFKKIYWMVFLFFYYTVCFVLMYVFAVNILNLVLPFKILPLYVAGYFVFIIYDRLLVRTGDYIISRLFKSF